MQISKRYFKAKKIWSFSISHAFTFNNFLWLIKTDLNYSEIFVNFNYIFIDIHV